MSKIEKPKPIDISNIDLDRMKLKTVDLPGLLEYAHSIGGFSVIPNQEGAIKGKAMDAMIQQTGDKLDMIYEQMKVLARQAREIKQRVDISNQIYETKMSFEPVIGMKYHLYEKEDREKVLSLISLEDWGSKMKYEKWLAEIELLADHTWRVLRAWDDEVEDI